MFDCYYFVLDLNLHACYLIMIMCFIVCLFWLDCSLMLFCLDRLVWRFIVNFLLVG